VFLCPRIPVTPWKSLHRKHLRNSGPPKPAQLSAKERKHIGLNGNQQFIGGLRKLSEQSLAANDDKFGRASDGSGGPDNMLKLWSEHGGSGT
jgi:hypothetical protein